MKYFKDAKNNVHAYESDGSQDAYIKEGLTPIDSEELHKILAEQALANEPTQEQVLQEANARREELMVMAGLNIAPLQDAVDLGKASESEISLLKLWKQYRYAVSNVASQTGFPVKISWPDPPSK